MLSIRQLRMFEDLCKTDVYLTANNLAQKYVISIRTVQNDIADIKKEMQNRNFIKIDSIPSKGSRIIVENQDELSKYLEESKTIINVDDLNSREVRIKKTIAILLCSKKSITTQHLADRLFISKSTFVNDLKIVKSILQKYEIELINISQTGIKIKGTEVNIRKCILKENIEISYAYNELLTMMNSSVNFRKVEDILVSLFTEYKYRISDVAFQNLIVHIDILIRRIEMGFIMDKTFDESIEKNYKYEYEIAKRLFEKCNEIFNTPISESEINHLAISLRGKSNYSDDSYITQEIDEFVLNSLMLIKNKFSVDFIDNIQLRVSLSLHLIPLLIRLKYNMQLKNELLNDMKKSFQVALDIASSFSYHIQEKYGYVLSEDEISYLAIYFNSALEEQLENEGTNRILIISSLKRSETLLLRERMNFWFSNSISELIIEDIFSVAKEDLHKFDVICTTEKNDFYKTNKAILISQFPTIDDYRKIKLNLDGFKSKDDFLRLFKRDMFTIDKFRDKTELLNKLSSMIKDENCDIYTINTEVLKREAMGGTYFGCGVAMPHPIYPVTSKTHISIALVNEGINWDDEGNKAYIVILVSMEKNNSKAFKIWSYLTELVSNEIYVNAIKEDMTYENFIKQLSRILDEIN